jgi:hypothetical protein
MDNRLTAMMIDDFLHDPVLAVNVIWGVKLPPHEELRLWGMWMQPFYMDHSGAGNGKSVEAAWVMALRSMLMAERTAGFISRTFRQGKMICRQYFDAWTESVPIFRNELVFNKFNDPATIHASDEWVYRFKNGSQIRMIPPGFSTEGEGAYSEDWTDGYFDEFSRMEHDVLSKVYIGRVRKPVPECYPMNNIFAHHLMFLGTASYTWNPAYRRVQQFRKAIAAGDTDYGLQSWNYRYIPDSFDRLRNDKLTTLRMGDMREDQIQTEVLGEWVEDSLGYYSARDIDSTRNNPCEILFTAPKKAEES